MSIATSLKRWFDSVRRRYFGRFGNVAVPPPPSPPPPPPSPPPSPPPPPPSSGIAVGVNMGFMSFWQYNYPFVNVIQQGEWQGTPAIDLPNLNAGGGWPSQPGTVSTALGIPISSPVNMIATWEGNVTGGSVNVFGQIAAVTNLSVDYTNRQATFTINSNETNANDYAVLTYAFTDGVNFPKNWLVKEVGTSGTFQSRFLADVGRYSGPIRFMDWNKPNFNPTNDAYGNLSAFPPGGTAGTWTNRITWATRNTLSSGDWNGKDGPPIEVMVELCNLTGRDLWRNYPWNVSSDYITNDATYARDHLSPGLKFLPEGGNENWNFSFPQSDQADAERAVEGLSHYAQRYAERHIEMMEPIEAVFSGQMSRVRRVLAWQTDTLGVMRDYVLAYNYAGHGTAKSHTDVLSCASYFGNPASYPSGGSYSSADLTGLFAELPGAIDDILAKVVDYKTLAETNGLTFHSYEGGQGLSFTDENFMKLVQRDPRMYDALFYWLQQFESLVGYPVNIYAHCGPITSQHWGQKEYEGQTISKATTPKFQAIIDYISGIRLLFQLTGAFTFLVGDANGTSLGTPGMRTTGSTYSLANNDGGRVAVNASTGEITLANTGLFSGSETRSFTIRETNANYSLGHRDTVLNYTAHTFSAELLPNWNLVSSSAPPSVGANTSALPGPLSCSSESQICGWTGACTVGHTYRCVVTYQAASGANLRVNNSASNGAAVPSGGIKPIVTDNIVRTVSFDFTAVGTPLWIEADGSVYGGHVQSVSLKELL